MEEILKWGAYILTAIIGWFVKTLWDAQAKLREDMKELEINLPKEYVSKTDFKELYTQLMIKLDKIESLFMTHISDAFKERTTKEK